MTLGPGDYVGEGLLLDETPHGTTARTLSPTEAYVLTKERVQEMVKENATLYAALVGRAARAISQRLAATDATLVGRGRTLSFGGARFRMEKDLPASAKYRKTRCTVCRRCARWKTSRFRAHRFENSLR